MSMSSVMSPERATESRRTGAASPRAEALASRLEAGAGRLAALAATLTDVQWKTPIPGDGRPIGVVVHHVATVYPLEIHLAQTVASGQPVVGITMDDVHRGNAAHARDHAGAGKEETIALLARNSAAAAAAIRALGDDDLTRAEAVSLYENAPLTCQFVLEDHAVRHSYHHVFKIEQALGR